MAATELKQKLEKNMELFNQNLRSLRVGRASAELVEHVLVKAYEDMMPLVQVASIQTPQHDQIIIQPWDAGLIGAIEEALRKADLNLNPVVDGVIIRISIPPLTEESRRDLVRLVHQHAEGARIAVRNIREEAMEGIERAEKEKEISEDDKFRQREETQKLVEEYNGKIKEAAEGKEKIIMGG